jgi:hypothetical protein
MDSRTPKRSAKIVGSYSDSFAGAAGERQTPELIEKAEKEIKKRGGVAAKKEKSKKEKEKKKKDKSKKKGEKKKDKEKKRKEKGAKLTA